MGVQYKWQGPKLSALLDTNFLSVLLLANLLHSAPTFPLNLSPSGMASEGETCHYLSSEKEMKENYLARMQSLQKIREVAGGHLDLPQMCVVGDQSSGKSALLSCLTGLNFPESSGICTRAPIVVQCRSANIPNEIYEIKSDAAKSSYTRCKDLDQLRKQISEIQEAAINKLSAATTAANAVASASKDDDDEGSIGESENATDDFFAACETLKKSTTISTEEICVRVSGPTQMDIIIIDLPGIIHNGDGADETRELIEKYCKPKQTLTLLVSEAKQDYESIEAVALAQKNDPDGRRTLRVLTKFDMFDSPESRLRAKNEIISNGKRGSVLASHAVVCRCDGSPYDAAKEVEILLQSGLPAAKSGVPALKSRLPALFSQLIFANLPNLRTQVLTQLENSQNVLEHIGTHAVEGMPMIKELQRVVSTQTEFEIILTPHLEQLREDVAQTKGRITKDWTDSFFQNNAFMISLFQGNDALLQCLDEITKWWAPLLQKYDGRVKKDVRSVSDAGGDRMKSGTLSAHFLGAVSAEWSRHCNEVLLPEFSRKCQESLQMEKDFGTINHYLDSKYQEEKVLPEELVEVLVQGLEKKIGFSGRGEFQRRLVAYEEELSQYVELKNQHDNTFNKNGNAPYKKPRPAEPPHVSILVREYLQSEREAYVARYEAKGLFDQQKERLHSAVLAVWAVEQKTFVDIVLKQTRDVIIKRREEWIHHEIYGNDVIRQNAVEDDEIRQKRSDAKASIEKMNQCLQELNDCERA